MENPGTTSTKNETQTSCLIYLSPDIDSSSFVDFNHKFTSKKYLSDLQVASVNNQFEVRSKLSNFESPLLLNQKNLFHFLKSLDVMRDNYANSDLTNKVTSLSLKSSAQNNIQQELNNIFLKSKTISFFSQNLFRHRYFSEFSSIHLFIHKKGLANSSHIHITPTEIQKSKESISEFSTLFQAVRKSKNRSFGQSSLKSKNFKIIGTCIAQEFSMLNHNLVFVFSKNDFLPQAQTDIDNFQSIKDSLEVFFELLLNSEFNHDRVTVIKNTIVTLLNFSGEDERAIERIENLSEDNYLNFDVVIHQIKERFFDHVDINLVERITLLGELLNTLQHELSNPLFGLELSSQILLGEELNEEQKLFVKNINSSIKRSQNILKNFSGLYKKDMEFEVANFYNVLKEVLTLTKSESRNVQKTIELEGLDVEECRTFMNSTWLAQIIFNLIINSTHATRDANITTPQILIQIKRSGGYFEISFTDNGPGIPDELQGSIFDPFYTTKSDGNGLGLAISKKLARKLGGDLTYNNISNGACFVLRIPA